MSEFLEPNSSQESNLQTRRLFLKSGLALVGGAALALSNVDSASTLFSSPAFLRYGRSRDVSIREDLVILAQQQNDYRQKVTELTGKKRLDSPWNLFQPKVAQATEEIVYSPFIPWTNDPEYFPLKKNGNLIDLQAENGPVDKFCQTYTLATGRECKALQFTRNLASTQLKKFKNNSPAEIESMGKCHAKAAVGLLEQKPTDELTKITNTETGESVEVGYNDRYGALVERHSGDLFYRPYTDDELAAGALVVNEKGYYVFEASGRDLFDRFAQYFFNADLENDPGARFEVDAPPTKGMGRWWRAVYGISQDGNQFDGTSFTLDHSEIFQASQVQFAQTPVFPNQVNQLSMRAKLLVETRDWRNPYLLNNPKESPEDRFEDFLLYLVYDPERLMEFAKKYNQPIEIETNG